jgi:hypothetical protein
VLPVGGNFALFSWIGGKMRTTFKALSIGDEFIYGGNRWLKQSSRTAKPLFSAFASYYYFGQSDNCFKVQ